MLNRAWVRRTAKRWVKETEYLRALQLPWPDSRLWFRRPGTLPSFLIVGAQRAGTTFLHDKILSETNAECSPLQKEVHFFDNKYYRSLEWYKKFFVSVENVDKINFETSPYYLYHPAVPKRVANSIPNVKLIVVLRDPLDRAISHYKWMRQSGLESRNAVDAFKYDAGLIELEFNPSYLKKFVNPLHFDYDHIYRSYIRRSLYHIQLKRWLEYFEPRDVLILSSSYIFNRPKNAINKISSSIGLRYSESKRKESPNKNQSRSGISVSKKAREVAQKYLQGVESKVKEIITDEMILEESLSFK